MAAKSSNRLIVGISGASGVIYGVRLLEALRPLPVESHLVMSKSAEITAAYETDLKVKQIHALGLISDAEMQAKRDAILRDV